MKKPLVLLAVTVPLALSGCATTPKANQTPQEQQQADRTATVLEGAGVGAGIGALAGGLIGSAGGRSGAAVGILIGAGIGAGIGAFFGNNIADLKQERLGQEASMDRQIAQTHHYVEIANGYQQKAQTALANLQKESDQLREKRAKKQLDAEEQKQYLAKIDDTSKSVRKIVKVLEEEHAAKVQVLTENQQKSQNVPATNAVNFREMEEELNKLQASIDTLNQDDAQLAKLNQVWR